MKQPRSHSHKSGTRTRNLLLMAGALAGVIFIGVHLMGQAGGDQPVIVLDAAHGGDDNAFSGLIEEDTYNEQLVEAIAAALEEEGGYEVLRTHEAGTAMTVADRAAWINETKPDLVISIGCDADYADASTSGTRIFADVPADNHHAESLAAAREVQAALAQAGCSAEIKYYYYAPLANGAYAPHIVDVEDTADYGQETLGILAQTEVPALVVRQLYVTSETDVAAWSSEESIASLGQAYAQAVKAYFEEDS
jgi:N-acetylmuramoyl-L-alanine amidase